MATKPEPKFTVGQEVWLSRAHRGDQRTTVEKVGRLYFEVAACRAQFSIETGVEKGSYGNAYRVRTLAEQARRERIAAADEALKAAGIRFSGAQRLSIATLEALAIVVGPTSHLPDEVVEAITVIENYADRRASEGKLR